MDRELFLKSCSDFAMEDPVPSGIGTLSEKMLHGVLKRYFQPDVTRHEEKIGRYIADIVNENGIIEIQTRNFSNLRKKLEVFLDVAKVTVVYPIPMIKWLSWMDENGELSKKRKSPKKGCLQDAFFELFQISSFLSNPNFSLCIVLLEVYDIRNLNGWNLTKKRGSTRQERIPLDIFEEHYFSSPKDYLKFLPLNLPLEFTVKNFRELTKITPRNASLGIKILLEIGIIEKIGKIRNAYVYKKSSC